MRLPVSRVGVSLEKNCALQDAQQIVWERGAEIVVHPRGETNVSRDKYESLKKRSVIETENEFLFRSFPVNYSPIEDDMKKAGLREKVDVIATTAMLDWNDHDVDPEVDIDGTRSSVVLRGRTYLIRDVGLVNHFEDTFLNVNLGLVRR